ncbi:MAG: VanZ family protein [Chitinophagaceae bacterium]|nr:VanZ family protein [Chitinophagaceae bacterium]
MKKVIVKTLILLPVIILTMFFLHANYQEEYRHVGFKRLTLFSITLLMLYTFFLICVLRWKQDSAWPFVVQSSFLVYFFVVLSLTGYFILFREITYDGWWQQMMQRINRKDHVNFKLLQIFKIYKITDKQILGNLVMLFPLGIYLPLLSKRFRNFFAVLIASLLVSVIIELLQLATSYRSTDIDDVLLNTTGACIGFIVYSLLSWSRKPIPAT